MVYLRFVVIGFAQLTIDDQLQRQGCMQRQDKGDGDGRAFAEGAGALCGFLVVGRRIGPFGHSTSCARPIEGSVSVDFNLHHQRDWQKPAHISDVIGGFSPMRCTADLNPRLKPTSQ